MRSFLLFIVALSLLTVVVKAESPVILGYYPSYERFPMERIPFERFTHICHAFATSDPEGALQPNKLVPSQKLTALAAKHKVLVLISIGGWGDADGFEAATSTPEKMSVWIDMAVSMMYENGYRGLDVDWEFPRDESTRDRFTALVLGLRQKLDELSQRTGEKYLITSAVTARPTEGKWIDGPAMEQAIDFLNVMTYDFAGPWSQVAAHHSPLETHPQDPIPWRSTTEAMRYWNQTQGFPKSKLVVGVPLYGRQMPVREPMASLKGLPKGGFSAPFYRDFVKFADQGWSELLGPDGSPFLVAPEGEVGLISYDSPTSGQRTGQWAKENDYRGVFFWGIGQDHTGNGEFPVMNAAIQGYHGE